MRTLILVAVAALAFGSAANAKPCKDATGKFVKCPAAATAPAAMASTAKASPAKAAMASPKECKKGKLCGNSCISVKDVCHK